MRPNSGAWDNGVLMDPGRPSYSREMVAQTQRRLAKIPHFQGMVVDRSDYSRYYNLEHDDGVTLTPSGQPQSWSMKRSYLEVIAKLRAAVGTTKVMLMNSLGYSSLSMMPSYDGTFSEGRAINAVGLLGAGGMGFGAAYATLDAHAARQKCEPDHELLAAPGTADATTRGAPDCRWG